VQRLNREGGAGGCVVRDVGQCGGVNKFAHTMYLLFLIL
jgi:hypothetical protein